MRITCAARTPRSSRLPSHPGRRSNRMRVRPAEFSDIPRLMAIARQSPSAAHWSEREYQALFPGSTLADGTGADAGSVPRRICLVVETTSEIAGSPGSPIAGFVVALCLDEEWEIENIVVDSALRRRGCANLLLRELLRLACDQGAGRVLLEVRESNRSGPGVLFPLGIPGNWTAQELLSRPRGRCSFAPFQVQYQLSLIDTSIVLSKTVERISSRVLVFATRLYGSGGRGSCGSSGIPARRRG